MNLSINSPTLVLDKQKAQKNIHLLASKAKDKGIKFRPHFKTHQSLEVGNWFREFDIDGITVSSLKMAEFFSDDGWDSITVAFPVNLLEIERINKLASNIDLRILSVDLDTLQKLESNLSSSLGIYLEIDPGYGRSGIPLSEQDKISRIIEFISDSDLLEPMGFYCHAGHSYNCRSEAEIKALSVPIVKQLSNLKAKYNLPVCFGDTPSCSVLEDFGSIKEMSPGNFVFYDWIQTKISSCEPSQIAVVMYCPVVAKYGTRNELLIHGGAIHFSKDSDISENNTPYYGRLVTRESNKWGNVIEGCYLKSISQEHGIVKCTPEFFSDINVGDVVVIFPIHSCLTADLMGRYQTTEGDHISHMSKNYK
ncbi:MAG: alanine racemase [Balneola sp.]